MRYTISILTLQFGLFLSVFISQDLSAQNPVYVGVPEADTLWWNQLPVSFYQDGRKGAHFPSRVSLRPFCPPPADQGSTGACAGFAFAYGALSIQKAVEMGTGISADEAFSPMFVYNQVTTTKKDCRTGANLLDVIKFLKEQGVCENRYFNPGLDCQALPDEPARVSALENRIKEAAVIFKPGDRTLKEQRIAQIRSFLADSIPVIANILVYDDFINPISKDIPWIYRKSSDYNGLKHFLVVVGYDDSRRVFEIMNSWSASWADDGFYKVGYDDFIKICPAACILAPTDKFVDSDEQIVYTPKNHRLKDDPVQSALPPATSSGNLVQKKAISQPPSKTQIPGFHLQGTFRFNLLTLNAEGHWVPQLQQVNYNPSIGLYECEQDSYSTGSLFQLVTTNIPIGKYVYVFTCDPKGKVDLHFPMQRQQNFLNPGKNNVVTIPSPENALQLSQSGDDFLCVVYSEEPVPDIHLRLQKIKFYRHENFMQVLNTAFSDILIDPTKVKFNPNLMHASCYASLSDGTAIAMVLKVSGK